MRMRGMVGLVPENMILPVIVAAVAGSIGAEGAAAGADAACSEGGASVPPPQPANTRASVRQENPNSFSRIIVNVSSFMWN
jgi:hypothetical protein